jgi:hypothetical protein
MEIEDLLSLNPFISYRTQIENLVSILEAGVLSQNELKKKGIEKVHNGPERQKEIGMDKISLWVIGNDERESCNSDKAKFTGRKLSQKKRVELILDFIPMTEKEVNIIISLDVPYTHYGDWNYEAYAGSIIPPNKIIAIIFRDTIELDEKTGKMINDVIRMVKGRSGIPCFSFNDTNQKITKL